MIFSNQIAVSEKHDYRDENKRQNEPLPAEINSASPGVLYQNAPKHMRGCIGHRGQRIQDGGLAW